MDREFRVIDDQGAETAIRATRHTDWDGLDAPCPACGGREFRHVTSAGARYELRETAAVRLSGDWGSTRVLFTQCLGCNCVLFRHPAFDLLYDPTGGNEAIITL